MYTMTVTVNKWGNNLGIQFPKVIAEAADLSAGKKLLITIDGTGKLILQVEEDNITLDDLIKGVTPENRHDVFINKTVGKEGWNY